MTKTRSKIYVNLLDEGLDVRRPVWAVELEQNRFEILDTNSGGKTENWEFKPGEVVECIEKNSNSETILLAIKKVSVKKKPFGK